MNRSDLHVWREKRKKDEQTFGMHSFRDCLTNWPPKLSLMSRQQDKTEDCSIGFLWTWQASQKGRDNGHTLLKLISRFWQAWLYTSASKRIDVIEDRSNIMLLTVGTQSYYYIYPLVIARLQKQCVQKYWSRVLTTAAPKPISCMSGE